MLEPGDRSRVLGLASRRSIYDYLAAHPGSHLRQIARNLALPLGTTLYHLDYLVQHDVVVARRDGRYKRFFAGHSLGRVEKDYVSVYHHEVPRRIVTVLLAKGRRTQRELCGDVAVSRSTLSFHVNQLAALGVVRCEERWPENYYAVADAAVAARVLAMFRERFESARNDPLADALPVASASGKVVTARAGSAASTPLGREAEDLPAGEVVRA